MHTVGDGDRRVQDKPIGCFQTRAYIDRTTVIGSNIETPQPRHAILVHRDLQSILVEDDSLRRH